MTFWNLAEPYDCKSNFNKTVATEILLASSLSFFLMTLTGILSSYLGICYFFRKVRSFTSLHGKLVFPRIFYLKVTLKYFQLWDSAFEKWCCCAIWNRNDESLVECFWILELVVKRQEDWSFTMLALSCAILSNFKTFFLLSIF